ncbi:MAG: IS3 family transposase, partial [Thiomonas sp.]
GQSPTPLYATLDLRVRCQDGFAGRLRWDNACSETLFGSLKVERLHGQRFKTRRQAMDEAVAWMLWYNRTRLHSTLAYVSPMRFEENWLANKPRQASA